MDVKDKRNLGIFISVTQGNRFGEKINIRNKKIGKIKIGKKKRNINIGKININIGNKKTV